MHKSPFYLCALVTAKRHYLHYLVRKPHILQKKGELRLRRDSEINHLSHVICLYESNTICLYYVPSV